MLRSLPAIAAVLTLSGVAAKADTFQTYDLEYANISGFPGDDAAMSGVITLDTTVLPNPSPTYTSTSKFLPIDTYVSALTLTLTGAPEADGTYTLADFSLFLWDTDSTVDFSRNLIGQILDLNFIDTNPDAYPNGPGPSGWAPFMISAGDRGFQLVSAEPVPEPSALLALGAGLLGLIAVRGRRRAPTRR